MIADPLNMIYYYGSWSGLILKTGFVVRRGQIESLSLVCISALSGEKVSDKTMLLALRFSTRTQQTDTV